MLTTAVPVVTGIRAAGRSTVAVAAREARRGRSAYGPWTVEALDRALHDETPRLGLWLDTSDLSVAETVDEIVRRAGESRVT